LVERALESRAPRTAIAFWVAGLPAATAFVATAVATTVAEPPVPALCAAVFVALLGLFVALTFKRAPDLGFVLPAASIYALFVIFPALQAFRLSLYKWSGYTINSDEFLGLENYLKIVWNGEFVNALWHGVALFGLMFLLHNTISLGLAVILDARIAFFEVYRGIIFLPVIISGVVTGFLWQVIFGSNIGLVNPVLGSLGLASWQQDWQGEPPWVFWVIVLVSFWAGNGFATVIYLAGLQGIPQDLKDAARIDGASGAEVFRHVTFPLLAPAFTVTTGLTFIGTMKALEIPMLIGGFNGGPFGSTDFLNLVIVRSAFGGSGTASVFRFERDSGYAVAVGVVMFLLILVIVSVQLVWLRRREVHL
jgi:ABC-type sugar transport system permease subunit